jgi:hypothetical protein
MQGLAATHQLYHRSYLLGQTKRVQIAFAAMAFAEIGDLVKAALGPLPLVCQEQVLQDLERARMAKEDTMAAERKMKREEEAKDQAIRRINQARQILEPLVFIDHREKMMTSGL